MSATATQLMTAEEFVRDYGDAKGVELVRGQLVRLPMPGFEHCDVCGNAYALIREHVKKHKLGRVTPNDTFIRVHRNPDSYRGADVLYISYERLPADQPRPKGPLEIPPELVVEVRSPSDRLKNLKAKAQEYLDAGVNVVVLIEPELEMIGVFRQDDLPIRFHNGDIVTIPDVLPGFEAPVKAFFE